MKIKLVNNEFKKQVEELCKDFPIELSNDGAILDIEKGNTNKLEFSKNKAKIIYKKTSDFYFMFGELISTKEATFAKEYTAKLELTYMADASRNAVMKVETAKKLIRHLAMSGYDSFMLYLEDTYIVKDYPYFGYLRNPYSQEDIKEIDEYASMFGIELIPCIQTLAHFNTLIRHYAMVHLFDVNDILLCDDENAYNFIESLIRTCRENFKSNRIHIGMDEAYLVGRGKYLDINGFQDKFDIMSRHVRKVINLCKKYDFEPMMWSDMYFSLALSSQYQSELPPEIISKIPTDISLVYWDYCSISEKHFYSLINTHKKLPNNIIFAGGAWKWLGFTPDNRYSFKEIKASMSASIKANLSQYILTGWGDNGAEASQFSILPSLYYCGRCKYGLLDFNSEFKERFGELFGISYKDFIKIDLANRITLNNDINERNTANKYLLFNDPLLGTLDTIITKEQSDLYHKHYLSLKRTNKKENKWTYILKTQENLCHVLEYKSTIGLRLREDYQNKDLDKLEDDLLTLKKIKKLLNNLYESFLYQWNQENRVNGFDVQDIRFGSLEKRIDVAIKKLSLFLKDNKNEIKELDEELLCFMGHNKEFEKDFDQCEYRWRRMTSVNVND